MAASSWRHFGSCALLGAGLLLSACGSLTLKMNDYERFGDAQNKWRLSQQLLFVVPVPAFNQPVRLRSVELRTVGGDGQFDPPTGAYLLVYQPGLFYDGVKLGEAPLAPQYTAGSRPVPLDSIRVHKLDNQLSIVIPVNIHVGGCHEARIALRVSTNDGRTSTLLTRWYVGLDTGVAPGHGTTLCVR